MPEALIALGGNVGDVRAILRKAIEIFCDGEEVQLRQRSSDYKTPPWGVTEQPPFVNAAIAVETGLEPRALLERAHAVERIFGRNRENEER
ncbi:MAG: 2-amino-4-hydroxy-6-hydroxymethyldihydropteridine diphosphokinase, partial [Pseudorhodoplanes sp.]|nr:2-amino-4-hydroxy-6-hydroxymethyldihydropteridine diphosphokinase [Pseudorhodoplanes sp.]